MHRRLCTASLLALLLPAVARAQSARYPQRPIRFVVPFGAGGGGDAVARILALRLSERLNNPVIVENRAGAGGNIGAEFVLRSPPDGYTLLNLSSTYAIQGALAQLNFDPIADLQPIMMVSRDPMVLVVHPTSKLRTLRDLVDTARGTPGKLSYATSGVGATSHLGVEELASRSGIALVHVPYKGSAQAFNDLLGNNVDLALTSATHAASFIKAGRVRALGLAARERLAALPDVPTMQEQGLPNYEVTDWKAIGGPKGMPADVVALLNTELNAVIASKSVRDKFDEDGTEAVGGSPEQMRQVITSDIQRWRDLARRANIRLA